MQFPTRPRYLNIVDGVAIPALQAAVTGSLAGLAVGTASAAARWTDPGDLGLAAGSIFAFFSWLAYRERWHSGVEQLLKIGAPIAHLAAVNAAVVPLVKVYLSQDQGRRGDYIDLPATREQLQSLADGLAAGRGFAQATWTGSGAPFSRSQWDQLSAEMIRRGLARWRNPNAHAQGVELLVSGRAVLKHFQSHSPTLSPFQGQR